MYEAIEAEQSVISCLIQRQESIETIYNMVSPEYFDDAVLGAMYHEYRKAFDEHKELTLVQLKQNLQSQFQDYEIDETMRNCAMMTAMPFEIGGYAEAVSNHYKSGCVSALFSRTQIHDATVNEQIDRLILELQSLQTNVSSNAHTVAEIAEEHKGEYFIDRDKPSARLNVEDLDNMIGGFEGGDLIIIGARPAVGKSALVTQWAEMFASYGLKVGFYNLEMTEKQVYERLVAAKSGIETTRLRMATRFHNDEKERYESAVTELLNENTLYISTGAKKVSDIRADQRKMKYDIIIIDYMQLLLADRRYQGNRAAEVGEISRQLKAIAIDYDIPVIALSQLTRSSELRAGHEPTMAELRESGNLEQDASVIILMWNLDDNDRSKKGLKVEKSRQGKTGRCDMDFDGAHLRFTPENDVAPFGS